MLDKIDRVTHLEASQFRFSSALLALSNDVRQIFGIVKKTNKSQSSMEERLDRVEQTQARLEEKIDNMSSQMKSIEMLLMRLVSQKEEKHDASKNI